MKRLNLLVIIMLLLSILIPSRLVFAAGESNEKILTKGFNGDTIYERNIANEDKEYVKKRNNLIEKYGLERAYNILGYKKINSSSIDETIVPDITDPGDGGVLTSSKTKDCMWYYDSNTKVASISVSCYKNYNSGIIDFVYEVDYNNPDFYAGCPPLYDDLITANFDGVDVYKVATSLSGAITDYKPVTYGGGGHIECSSSYAYIIFTTKPRSQTTMDNAHGNAYMEFANKFMDAPENISFSLSNGYISISSGSISYYKKYYNEITW